MTEKMGSRFYRWETLKYNGVENRGVFTIVPISDAAQNTFIVLPSLITAKQEKIPAARETFRLVVQAHDNDNYVHITYASTVQRVSQRLLQAIHALD